MRILHTSDWHLGRVFHGASLLDEQAAVVDRIVALAAEHQVELVVVAGDLFDRSIPPVDAVDLLGEALARLRATGAVVAAISGNHDSPARVGSHDRLLNQLGVAVRGQVDRVAEPLVIAAPADGGPPVATYLVPYLEPTLAVPVLDEPAAQQPLPLDEPRRPTHDRAMRLATGRALAHHRTLGKARSVVVAHGFVAGGRPSASERQLAVGGAAHIGLDAFDGFDLVALGHLHHAQVFAGGRVAYAGAPLCYSFSEEGRAPSVRLVDLRPDGHVEAHEIALGVGRPRCTLTGAFDELLVGPRHAHAEAAFVSVVVTDGELPGQAMARLQVRFPFAVELRHEPAGLTSLATRRATRADDVRRLEPLELALRFWEEQHGAAASAPEADLLASALAAALAEEDDGCARIA